ncbi:MAG: M24 family metallopeptidase [Bacteroidota bacterium]
MNSDKRQRLIEAEKKAWELFAGIEQQGLICAGKTEKELNKEVFQLADQLFGIKKFWHKRIIRAGANTLEPYNQNPPDLTIQVDDILFLDFGPVFEDWEADIGKTYVLGTDPDKLRLRDDTEWAWQMGKARFDSEPEIKGSELYAYLRELAAEKGWELGGKIGGHLIGNFPHSKIFGRNIYNYIHPSNRARMRKPYKNEIEKDWILEIHFIDREKQIGGFFEQLL